MTKIGKKAFSGDKHLEKVTLNTALKTIGAGAFLNCTGLKGIVIKNKVTKLGRNAFGGCQKMSSLTLGKSVTNIGQKAFYNCSSLKKIKVSTTSLKRLGANSFSGISAKAVISVPKKKLAAYKKMWKKAGAGKKAVYKTLK